MSPVTALSPRAQGSLHTAHAHTRSTVDSLLGGDEEGYLSPLDDAFSVMSDDNPLLPAYYQARLCPGRGCKTWCRDVFRGYTPHRLRLPVRRGPL